MRTTDETGVATYAEVRALTEALAAPLSPEDQTVQSMPDASPTKWHRAHTTWFFETFVLEPHLPGYERHDAWSAYLFNSYYETLGPRHDRGERGLLTRPGAAEVGAYRAHVDEAMAALLAGEVPGEVAALVELGLHHEQQHQELLLMDAKHLLSMNPIQPAYRATTPGATPPGPLTWSEHPGGLVEVGADGRTFAFDNEQPRHRHWLEPFQIAERLVTCEDWLAFMADDGYHRPELWLSAGWATICAERWEAPQYWEPVDGWTVFTLAGRRRVDPAEPVCHVSYYEADAYARWAGARLPSEAEWEVVATGPVSGGLLDLDRLHPTGAGGWYGDAWVWTASPYGPYPGYRPAPGAVGEYNGKFMVDQQVLRGGSCLTPEGHVRPTYRNFFPAAARWPMTGVRLARGEEPSAG